MQINIHVPRPKQTLVVLAIILASATGYLHVSFGQSDKGSGGADFGLELAKAQHDVDRERIKQAVLEQQEEILRYQLGLLEEEALRSHDEKSLQNLQERRQIFLGLTRDRKSSEQVLLSALETIWAGEGTAYSDQAPEGDFRFQWPIFPKYGLSAHFHDEAYKKLFARDHHAVDIPTEESTPVLAAADGTIEKVSMNGYGYSFIVIKHADGFETVYGHVSQALVKEGDKVRVGDAIGLSGGAVGGLGSGPYTTGPHLHWAVKKSGALVDPEKYVGIVR